MGSASYSGGAWRDDRVTVGGSPQTRCSVVTQVRHRGEVIPPSSVGSSVDPRNSGRPAAAASEGPDQSIRCLAVRPVTSGAAITPALAAGDQALLGYQLGHRLHADPPPSRPQIRGDPRGAVATVVAEQAVDLGGQRRPTLASQRGIATPPLVEPGLRHPSSGTPTECGMPWQFPETVGTLTPW